MNSESQAEKNERLETEVKFIYVTWESSCWMCYVVTWKRNTAGKHAKKQQEADQYLMKFVCFMTWNNSH